MRVGNIHDSPYRTDLVGDYRNAEVVEPGIPFVRHTRVGSQRRTVPGHIGWPLFGNSEKGEVLFSSFAADVQSLLERMIRWDGISWGGLTCSIVASSLSRL